VQTSSIGFGYVTDDVTITKNTSSVNNTRMSYLGNTSTQQLILVSS